MVVGKPAATVITSSLGFNDLSPNCSDVSEERANKFAEEPELVVITCFIPKNSLRRFSNSLLNLPVVNQKSRDDETSICISASPKTFPETGIKDFPGINGFSA